jgi:hypothetical protein
MNEITGPAAVAAAVLAFAPSSAHAANVWTIQRPSSWRYLGLGENPGLRAAASRGRGAAADVSDVIPSIPSISAARISNIFATIRAADVSVRAAVHGRPFVRPMLFAQRGPRR